MSFLWLQDLVLLGSAKQIAILLSLSTDHLINSVSATWTQQNYPSIKDTEGNVREQPNPEEIMGDHRGIQELSSTVSMVPKWETDGFFF